MSITVLPSFERTYCAMQMTRRDIPVAITSSQVPDKGRFGCVEIGPSLTNGLSSDRPASRHQSHGMMGSPMLIASKAVQMAVSLGRLHEKEVEIVVRWKPCSCLELIPSFLI